MRLIGWVLLASAFAFPQTAEEIVLDTEKSIRALSSLQATFDHIYYSANISTPLRERGRFHYQRPDLMRWEYEEPESKIFLFKADGYEFYFPEDNQVMRGVLSEERHETEILNILSGQRDLLDRYSAEIHPFPSENAYALQIKLTPKEKEEDYFILLEVDRGDSLIHKIVFLDWEGNKTEFHFSHMETNASLPAEIFELVLPPDVEIIEDRTEHPY
jgi:outer membrane lipoprotein carrier protein